MSVRATTAPESAREPEAAAPAAAPAEPRAQALLALQRTAGNRAARALVLARQPAPASRDPRSLSDAELFTERNSVATWMREHAASDPGQAPMQQYGEALEAEVGRREGRHTGGFTATSLISGYDANVRIKSYVEPVRDLSKKVLDDYAAGKLTHLEGREQAHAARNAQLETTRGKLSPGGRAFSEGIKEEGLTLDVLTEKYARKVVEADPAKWGLKSADDLADPVKAARAISEAKASAEVSEQIMKSAGRTGKAVTIMARVSRVAGPVGTGVGLAISGYEIYEADDATRSRVVAREGGGFAGGLIGASAGGLVAGWAASLACGPGAPVCAIVISLVIVGGVAYAGGRGGEATGEWIHDGGLREVGKALAELGRGIGETIEKGPAIGGPATVFSAGGGFGGLMERDRRRAYSQPPPAR